MRQLWPATGHHAKKDTEAPARRKRKDRAPAPRGEAHAVRAAGRRQKRRAT
jgi:hypothetical protein